MSEAPKDREIFAVYLRRDAYGAPTKEPDPGNIHPLMWKERPWVLGYRARWGMRWNEDFETTLADYGGWFDPKDLT